jgi:hypothetical protein
MSLVEITYLLRTRLIGAIKSHDKKTALELKTTFMTLKEAAYGEGDIRIPRLFEALEDIARDAANGEGMVSEVPSNEQIKDILEIHD